MDATFWGWGGHGAKTRTRDRGTEPVAKKLKATGIWTASFFVFARVVRFLYRFSCGQVMSVIYVQNAEAQIGCRNLSVKLTMVAWFLTCILGTRTGVCQLSCTKRRD